MTRLETLRRVKLSARMRLAARFYATGAAPTKKAAALAAGIHPAYFTTMSVVNPEVSRMIGDIDTQINDQSIALSKIVAIIARRAAGKINQLIDSPNEHIALKASSDILDRNPETSKTIKATVTSFSLDGQDAKEIAAAMVEAARVKEQFREMAMKDYVRVEDDHAEEKEARLEVHTRDHDASEDERHDETRRLSGDNGSLEGRKEESQETLEVLTPHVEVM